MCGSAERFSRLSPEGATEWAAFCLLVSDSSRVRLEVVKECSVGIGAALVDCLCKNREGAFLVFSLRFLAFCLGICNKQGFPNLLAY